MKADEIKVVINENGRRQILSCKKGRGLSDLLKSEGIHFAMPCGGMGRCGKCRVRVTGGYAPVTSADASFFDAKELDEGYRLLCRMVVRGDCEIELSSGDEEKMLIDTAHVAYGSDDQCCAGASPDREDGKRGERSAAIAVDLGTTTIAAALVEKVGEEFVVTKTAGAVNHQNTFGSDVISRIAAAKDCENLARMRDLVRSDIEGLIGELLKDRDYLRKVSVITVAGNAAMLGILSGEDVSGLGKYPYTPPFLDERKYEVDLLFPKLAGSRDGNEELFGQSAENGNEGLFGQFAEDGNEGGSGQSAETGHCCAGVSLLPGISAFVGADILSGLFYLDILHREKALFLDLGTNGEMAYWDGGKLLVTSAAAGPVFEGGGISCGMPSLPGAICHVTIDDATHKGFCETIGDEAPVGLCGTGVMEAVSELVRCGICDETGLLSEEYFDEGFPLTRDGSVRITTSDIRNVQLGKAAISTAIRSLTGGAVPDKVYISGGFGAHIDSSKIQYLSMLPAAFNDKIIISGNTSLLGAVKYAAACLSGPAAKAKAMEAMNDIRSAAQVVELSFGETFGDDYIKALNF
jgi:uncharacterized 2Fe-2S/4Fe-4S cluster protein (DUF4445 family)